MNNDREIVAALADAVRRRCNPGTGRTVKAMAAGIGASVDAVERWLTGRARVPAWAIAAMDSWFRRVGGGGDFIAEVFGTAGRAAPLPMTGGSDLCWWVTPAGELISASFGHEAAARTVLKVEGVPGDWAAYAVRAGGWVAITLTADGRMILRLSQRRAATAAVARVCAWLPGPAPVLAGLTVAVLHGQHDWTTTEYETIAAARRALESVVGIGSEPAQPQPVRMTIERRAIATQADPVMSAALRAWDGSLTGARAIGAAIAAAGGSGRAGLLRASGDGYVCADLGAGLPIASAIIGRPIRDLGEPDYVREVSAQYDITRDEGRPTVHRIGIDAYGDHGLYDRWAAPVDDDGVPAVLVISRVIDPPRRVVLGQDRGRA